MEDDDREKPEAVNGEEAIKRKCPLCGLPLKGVRHHSKRHSSPKSATKWRCEWCRIRFS